MWSSKLFLLVVASTTVSASLQTTHRRLALREFVTADGVSESYDFVIAGGGTAGLALATRLSADENIKVLVIEAGDVSPGDDVDVPANTYFKTLTGPESGFDWAFRTAEQPSAGGRNVPWPRGKILGGSSAINGMYLIRPHEIEISAWHDLISSQPDADSWTWDSMFAAMKKSESFTPPSSDVVDVAGMQFNADSHGTDGPVHHSYPGYMVPISQHWLPTLDAAGVALNSDPYSGRTVGGFFSLSAINPSNWTRSYAKSAYLDPLPPRSNLHILVNNVVTRIIFDDNSSSSNGDGGLKATGVEFASSANAQPKTVKVDKEVIVSGGSVNSPQILQLSGVGPSDVLKNAGVDVKLDLPGVGTHLQDHYSAPVVFKTSEQTQGDIFNSGSDLSKSPEFRSFINSGVAYVNASTLFGGPDGQSAMHTAINANMSDIASTIGTGSSNSEVLEGYKAIYSATSDKIFNSENALVELLYSINSAGQVQVQAAIQHAFSQGRVYVNSKSAFDAPTIDPQYFSHWADVVTMREGLKLARRIAQTPPLSTILGDETFPGPNVSSDEDWDNWLRSNGGTEFHPTSSCAMLPRDKGGVVDNKLKVYGVRNVRVVDASVFPVNFAAHTMTPTYALAEIAAEIIQKDYAPPSPGGDNQSDSGDDSDGRDGNAAMSSLRFNAFGTLVLGGFATFLAVVLNSL